MSRYTLAFVIIAFAAARSSAADAPATQPAATVTGRVTCDGDVPASEIIVYLESADPKYAVAPPAQAVKISQKDAQFDPKVTIICQGQTVEFLNDESRQIEHNVFSTSAAKRFDLGLYGPGEQKTLSFDKPGPVFLYCSIHRYMDGVVFVSPSSYFSHLDAGGKYEIADVPAGQWKVCTWQRRRRFPELAVPITIDTGAAGKPVTADLELKRK